MSDGLFDDLPEAKTGLFDDLPEVETPQVAGRWTREPRNIKEFVQMTVGGVLHPIRTTETIVETVGSAVAGRPMQLMVRPSEVLERKTVDFPELKPAKTTAGKVASGVANAAIEFAEFLGTPEALLTLGLGSVKREVQRLVLADYAADMAVHAPGQLQDAITAAKAGDIQKAAQLATSGAGGAFLSARITRHLSTKPTVKEGAPIPDVEVVADRAEVSGAPATAEALKEILPDKEPTPAAPTPEPVMVPPAGESMAKTGAEAEKPTAPEPMREGSTPDKPVAPESFADLPEVPKPLEVPRQTPTALRNAMIEKDRAAMGLPAFEEVARQDYREAWDEAMATLDRDPMAQDKLIADLKAKPRALRDARESALLHHRMIELKNEHARATAELAKANEEGRTEDAASIQSMVDMLSDQALELTDITKAAGREWGRTGLARQQLVADDFSYIGLEVQKRAAVGGRKLTAQEKSDLSKLAADYEAKMQELQRQLLEASTGRTLAEAQGGKYSPKLLEHAERLAKALEVKAVEASARLKEKMARTSAGVDPTILSDVAIIGAAKIARGAVDFAKWSEAMLRDVGEWLKPELRAAWDASNKLLDQEIKGTSGIGPKAKATAKKRQAAINEARGELNKLESDFTRELQQNRASRGGLGNRVVRETARGLSSFRTLKTAYDVSAVLRQGGPIVFGHPVRGARSIMPMLKAFASEKAARTLEAEIQNRPNATSGLYQRAKLFLAPLDAVKGREEVFLPSWVDKLPGIRGSQHAYVSFLNKLRADSFDAMVASLRRNGESVSQRQAEAIANYINVATGRGELGKLSGAAEGLAAVFFSPRLVASRFQLLLGQPFVRGDLRTRRMIAGEYARALMGLSVVYALGTIAGADVEDDPRSSDFGKLKFGDTRVDPLMGLAQNTVLLTRLTTGEKKALSGAITNLRDPKFGQDDASDVIKNFLRSKLAPVPGATVSILAGENVVGEPTTPKSVALDLTVPLSWQDIRKIMEEHDLPEATVLSMLSLLGMGVQHYEAKGGRK